MKVYQGDVGTVDSFIKSEVNGKRMDEGQAAKDSNVSEANREPSNHDESRAGKVKKRLTVQLMQ